MYGFDLGLWRGSVFHVTSCINDQHTKMNPAFNYAYICQVVLSCSAVSDPLRPHRL